MPPARLELDLRALGLHDQLGSVDAGAGVAKAGAGFCKSRCPAGSAPARCRGSPHLVRAPVSRMTFTPIGHMDLSAGRPLGEHGGHLLLHSAVVAGLDAPQRRHHIHLAGAIGKSLARCRSLDRPPARSHGESPPPCKLARRQENAAPMSPHSRAAHRDWRCPVP